MDMFKLTVDELSLKIGQGKGMTGAGTVACISAIHSIQIVSSVCKLTLAKVKYKQHWDELKDIDKMLGEHALAFKALTNKDAADVGRMVKSRVMRDKATDEKSKLSYSAEADRLLAEATQNTVAMCSICMEALPLAKFVFEYGLKSAAGDSYVALNGLMFSLSSAVYMSRENIKHLDAKALRDSDLSVIEKSERMCIDYKAYLESISTIKH